MIDTVLRLRVQNIGDLVAKWGMLALFFFLPFFLIPNDWIAVVQAKMFLVVVAVAVIAVAWIIARVAEGAMRVPKSFLLYAGAALPLAYLISALVASRTWGSFVGTGIEQGTVVSVFVFYLLFAISALVLQSDFREAALAARVLVLGGGVLVALQIFRLIFPETASFGGALPSTVSSAIGSWHDLGIFLGLLLFLSLSLKGLTDSFAGLRRLRIGIGIAAGVLLILINAPDVWIALAILGFLYGVYKWYSAKRFQGLGHTASLRTALSYFVVAVLSLSLYFTGTAMYNKLPAPLQLAQAEVRPSWIGTYVIGKESFQNVRDYIVGLGPNTFARAWGQHKPLSVNATQFWSTDFNFGIGIIPTALISAGLLGLLSWGAFLFALIWLIIRFLRAGPSENNKLAGAVLAGAVYLFGFQIAYVPGIVLSALSFLLFGLFIALQVSGNSITVRTIPLDFLRWSGKAGTLAVAGLALLLVFGTVQSLRALVSDTLVNRAIVTYSKTGDVDSAEKIVGSSLTVLGGNDRAHRTAVELGLQKINQLIAQNPATDAARTQLQDVLQNTLQHGIAAVSSGSGNYQNWLTVGRLYGELAAAGIQGADSNAREAYKRAQAENPTSPLPFLGLAQLDFAAGNSEAVRQNLNSALGVKADLTAAHFLLSQINAQDNDLRSAQEEATVVVQLAPQDALAWYNLGLILYARKSYQDATVALERAVQLQNGYANALFVLGLSYYELDKTDEAVAAISEVARLNPTDPLPKNVLANIKTGKEPFKEQTIGR